jgi:hypothetical protein
MHDEDERYANNSKKYGWPWKLPDPPEATRGASPSRSFRTISYLTEIWRDVHPAARDEEERDEMAPNDFSVTEV